MSTTLHVEEVPSTLPELISQLSPGEEVVITQNDQLVAELRQTAKEEPRPKFGSYKGMLTIVTEDDEHLEDFKEYMS